jgi:predicted transcriptional regulator YdeE
MLLGGLRRYHRNAEAAAGIPAQWREFRAGGPLPGRVGGNAYGVICGHDADGIEYLCAHEVSSLEALPAGTGKMRVTPQRYAVFVHAGHVADLGTTWQHILHQWLPASGHASAHRPDFEVYGPDFEPGAGLGPVEVWVSIAR